MALLGAQLVITLVMISIIQKLGPYCSFARYLLCSTGLTRYLYPTDSELRQLANIPKDKSKSKKGNKSISNGKATTETFHVPRSIEIQLETSNVTYLDAIHLRYYSEYQWLVDFAIYAGLVYTITEVYQIWFPITDEVNLSMVWCFLVILFALHVCAISRATNLQLQMLADLASNVYATLGIFIWQRKRGPASKIVLKFFIALWCGLLGALLTFPGMRIAKMHWDLLKYYRESRTKQILLNLSFALPFLLVILWIKPISRDYLTVRIFSGRTEPLMATHTFEILRIAAILFTMGIKIFLIPWYLQAYLDMAYHRTEDQKKEAGRITNTEFQKKIAAVFYYLCVVALQYIAPIILCLYFTLMYKTLGNYSWSCILNEPQRSDECPLRTETLISDIDPFDSHTDSESVARSTAEFHMTLEGLKSIFTADVFRGLFGFSTWWCCFTYFATSSVGLVYQSYFSNV